MLIVCMFLNPSASSNIMVLAKPWHHTAIICAKKSFNTIKNCKKIEILYVTTSSCSYFNFYLQYNIFSMIIQNRTISVALTCMQGQTSKKAYKNLNITNSIEVSSVARGGGGAIAPPLACRPKCRIRKIPRF